MTDLNSNYHKLSFFFDLGFVPYENLLTTLYTKLKTMYMSFNKQKRNENVDNSGTQEHFQAVI